MAKNDIKDKNKEIKRLQESFKLLKQTNETLKQQNIDLNDKNLKLDKQLVSLNSRLSNLQLKYEYKTKKEIDVHKEIIQENNNQNVSDNIKKKILSKETIRNDILNINSQVALDTISYLFDWIIESNLSNIDFNIPFSANNKFIDTCPKLIQIINDYLLKKPKFLYKYHLSFLKFTYWSLVHSDQVIFNLLFSAISSSVFHSSI